MASNRSPKILRTINNPEINKPIIIYDHAWRHIINGAHGYLKGKLDLLVDAVVSFKADDFWQFEWHKPYSFHAEFDSHPHLEPRYQYLRVCFTSQRARVLVTTAMGIRSVDKTNSRRKGVSKYVMC